MESTDIIFPIKGSNKVITNLLDLVHPAKGFSWIGSEHRQGLEVVCWASVGRSNRSICKRQIYEWIQWVEVIVGQVEDISIYGFSG